MRRQLLMTDEGVVDAVVGYRSWEARAVEGVVHLTGIVRREVEWGVGVPIHAECECAGGYLYRHPYATYDDVEGVWHTCGIYAWSRPMFPSNVRCYTSHTYIVGEVLLWGTVRRHVRGYRAEIAQPSAFYVVGEMSARQRTMTELAALQYDVPLVAVSPRWDIGPVQEDATPSDVGPYLA